MTVGGSGTSTKLPPDTPWTTPWHGPAGAAAAGDDRRNMPGAQQDRLRDGRIFSSAVPGAGDLLARTSPPHRSQAVAVIRGRKRQGLAVIALLAVGLAWLPSTLLSDVRGARANARLSHDERRDARGPAAMAGTNLALTHAAQRLIPKDQPFAIVRSGRWGTDAKPTRRLAFVWQSGQAWTQFALAPRVQVEAGEASWLLVRDGSPTSLDFGRVIRSWRFGSDWLVER